MVEVVAGFELALVFVIGVGLVVGRTGSSSLGVGLSFVW